MFTGEESEEITLEQAICWTGNYRADNPGQIKAHFFGSKQLMKIIDQEECVGIRAYYAIDDDGVKQLVLVGVDSTGTDLVDGVILDRSILCPIVCDPTSPLK